MDPISLNEILQTLWEGVKGLFSLMSVIYHLSSLPLLVFTSGLEDRARRSKEANDQGMNYDCIYNHIDDIRYLDSQYVMFFYIRFIPDSLLVAF